MNVLSRYLFRYFAAMLGLVLPGVVGIYLLIEAAEKLYDIIGSGAPFMAGASYFFLIIPRLVYELAPMAVMLSGFLSVMLLSRHGEILALRASGVSPWWIIRYFLLFAVFISALMLAAQILFIPKATEAAKTIWRVDIKKQPLKGTLKDDRLFYHGEGDIWTARLARPDAKVLQDAYVIKFDNDYNIIQIIGAMRAEYLNDEWVFHNGFNKMETPQKGPGFYVNTFDSLGVKLDERPEDFVAVRKPPAEMSMVSLWKGIQRLRQSGYDPTEQEAVLWGEITYPFLGVALLWLGLPIMLQKERGGLAIGLGIGLAFGFATLASWDFFIALGKTGKLPPLISAIMTHLLLLGAGFAALKRIK